MKKIMLVGILFSMGVSFNAVSEEALFCDESNYEEFIWNGFKTDELIEKTGEGCDLRKLDVRDRHIFNERSPYLPPVDLRRAKLSGLDLSRHYIGVHHQPSLEGADFRDSNLDGVTIRYARVAYVGSSWPNMKFKDLHPKLSEWILKGAKYNERTIFPPEGENPLLDHVKETVMINCSEPRDESEREACES